MKKLTINNREDGQNLANALLLARSDPPVGKWLDPCWEISKSRWEMRVAKSDNFAPSGAKEVL